MVHFIWACNKIKKMFVENTISIYASNVVFFKEYHIRSINGYGILYKHFLYFVTCPNKMNH